MDRTLGVRLRVEVGNTRSIIVFSAEPSTIHIPLHLRAPATRVTIDGLRPVSPASLGHSSDSRHIAVALIRVDR